MRTRGKREAVRRAARACAREAARAAARQNTPDAPRACALLAGGAAARMRRSQARGLGTPGTGSGAAGRAATRTFMLRISSATLIVPRRGAPRSASPAAVLDGRAVVNVVVEVAKLYYRNRA